MSSGPRSGEVISGTLAQLGSKRENLKVSKMPLKSSLKLSSAIDGHYGNRAIVIEEFASFHYAVFFAYIRLREQEIRNLMLGVLRYVGRLEVLRIHTKNMKLAEDVNEINIFLVFIMF